MSMTMAVGSTGRSSRRRHSRRSRPERRAGRRPRLGPPGDGWSRRTLIGDLSARDWRARGALGDADLDGALAQSRDRRGPDRRGDPPRGWAASDSRPHSAAGRGKSAPRARPLKPRPRIARQDSGRASRARPMRAGRGEVEVVGEGAGGAGQDALQAVAGEVAGLVAGLDVGDADPDPIAEVREMDGLDGTDLDALTALDAGGEKLLLLEPVLDGPRRAQPGIGLTRSGAAGPPGRRPPRRPPGSRCEGIPDGSVRGGPWG